MNDTIGNRILDPLEPGERDPILADARRVDLDYRVHVGARDGAWITWRSRRPQSCPLGTVLRDGSCIEAGTVGNECLLGQPIVPGGRALGNVEAICQVHGEAVSSRRPQVKT